MGQLKYARVNPKVIAYLGDNLDRLAVKAPDGSYYLMTSYLYSLAGGRTDNALRACGARIGAVLYTAMEHHAVRRGQLPLTPLPEATDPAFRWEREADGEGDETAESAETTEETIEKD